ncbi:MAG: hypothetical protein HKP58_10855 [Desulfatitalea sp.]|nr:hypothetical protein [Desulfatitalea sp.]NNK00899.1 hypothetical protein [Desulfatitalea sp.]
MMRPAIGIVIAMPSEARALFGRSGARRMRRRRIPVLSTGPDAQLLAICGGVGLDRARTAADRLVMAGASALVSIGLAGGLDDRLPSGHLVVASKVRLSGARQGERAWCAHQDAAVAAYDVLAAAGAAVSRGPLLTAQRAVLSTRNKRTLFLRTQALSVDLESAAVASAAQQAGIPFFGLRAVCDTARQCVPQVLSDGLDSYGRIHLAVLLRALLVRPALAFDLMRMGRSFAVARRSLTLAWRLLQDRHVLFALLTAGSI